MKTKAVEIIIKPKAPWGLVNLEELFRYRELFYIFSWRDLKVRYKQTFLGIAWVILQPLVSMAIFTVFFGRLAKIPSGTLPYSLFVLCGLIFWTFFSTSVTTAANSMITNENIIKKVYFPKIILPLSAVLTGIVDFIINFIILMIVAIILGFTPSLWMLLILPAAVLVTLITSFGVGLFLASLNVKYRDVRYILPFFIQLLLFLTPVIYSLSILSTQNRLLMALNPMTLVIESFRTVFAPQTSLTVELVLISIASSLIIFLLGLWYFKRTEQFFADIV